MSGRDPRSGASVRSDAELAGEELNMGQAKLRGTKELRIAQAVQRDRELKAKRAAEQAKREAAERERVAQMSLEEQERYRKILHRQRMTTAMLLGLVFGFAERPLRGPRKPANYK